jgi:phosphomannomutase
MITELLSEVGPSHYQRVDLRLTKPISKDRMVERLADSAPDSIGGVKIDDVSTMDGAKYILADDSWLLIRPSGTEPVLRVYAEARETAMVEELLDYGRSLAAES